jgi:hypothetical protein
VYFRRVGAVAWFVWLIYIFFNIVVCINVYVFTLMLVCGSSESLVYLTIFTVYPVKLGTVVVAVDGVFVVPRFHIQIKYKFCG